MSDMADVLAEHPITWVRKDHPTEDRVDFVPTCGKCGRLVFQKPDEHRAQALSAAGFGPVQEARAEAWRVGYEQGWRDEQRAEMTDEDFGPHRNNPYREDT